jgi:hypothetical protein
MAITITIGMFAKEPKNGTCKLSITEKYKNISYP